MIGKLEVRSSLRRGLGELAVMAAVYYVSGKFALLLAIPPGYATAVWPPAGFALAGLLLFGDRLWPGVLLGSFCVNIAGISADGSSAFLGSVLVAASIATGAALQAIIGARLIRRAVASPTTLIHDGDIVKFLLLGGPLASLVAATWGVASLALSGTIEWTSVPFSWWTWWVGDTMGALTFAPLTVMLFSGDRPLLRRRLPAVGLPVALMFAASVTLFVYASAWEHGRSRRDFDQRSDAIARALQGEVDGALEVLHSISGLYASSQTVSRAEFRTFVDRLLWRHRAVEVLSWNLRVTDAARPAVEQAARADGFDLFTITEITHDGRLVPATDRPEYVPVYFLEPYEGNEPALGFDVASDPHRRDALKKARDTGSAAATPRVRLVQDRERASGVVLMLPIYRPNSPQDTLADRRQNLIGYATGVFRIRSLIQASLERAPSAGINTTIVDESDPARPDLLFDGGQSSHAVPSARSEDRTLFVDVAGRRWGIHFVPDPAYLAAHRSWEAWSVLAAGLLFTGILQALLLVVTGRTAAVQAEVVKRTGELRTSELRQRMVLETAYDAFIAMDDAGVVTEWNREAERTFGWSRAEAIGRTVAELCVPPGYRDAHRKGLARFLTTGRSTAIDRRIEITAVDRTGRSFPVELTISHVLDGAHRFNAFIRDVTERQANEQALRTSETRYRVLAEDLQIAKDAAETATRAKSDFLASMSHELRTPMNSILGFTQLLLRSLRSSIGDEDLDALQTVQRNAKHLLALINQILDLSKVEAGTIGLDRTSFDLRELVREVAHELRPTIEEKPIALSVHVPAAATMIEADRMRVRQILINLVANAIKYTERGEVAVYMAAGSDPDLGDVVRVDVRDTGPGIANEDRARLFQRFSRLDTPVTRREGGTGLGLSLSAEFAAMHGGRLEMASDGRSGSEFTLILPTGSSGSRLSVLPSAALLPPVSPGLTILCIDDDPDILKFLERSLREAGYRVVLAASFEQAAAQWHEITPDLVCLDIHMPGIDGFEILDRLRRDEVLAAIPVVVISANSGELRAIEGGARRYLVKPFDPETLLETVRGVFASAISRVLIVEDDPESQRLLRATLERQGLTVTAASNGAEALERLREQCPDAIVLDLGMPVMDGLEFLDRMANESAWADIPVVVLTGADLDPDAMHSLAVRCRAVLTKGLNDTVALVKAITAPPPSRRELATGALEHRSSA